jgi:Poly(A) polymerase catalytic subunit
METIASQVLEKQLLRLESLIDRKETLIEAEYYEKYAPIYEHARLFLKKKNVLMYGGTAINALLPKKHKFYRTNELPDYDVFIVGAKKHGMEAVRYFKKQGYDATTLVDALHPDSFKIIVSGLTVIDMTSVSRALFKILAEDKRETPMEIPTVNPQFLRLSLHMLLSQPKDAFRWKKILVRMLAFYKTFPPKNLCTLPAVAAPDATEAPHPAFHDQEISQRLVYQTLQEETLSWIKSRGYVLFSPDAWVRLLPKNLSRTHTHLKNIAQHLKDAVFNSDQMVPMDFLIDIADGNLENLRKEWEKYIKEMIAKHDLALDMKRIHLTYTKVVEHPLIPTYQYALLNGIPIVGFYISPACLSYITLDTESQRVLSPAESKQHPHHSGKYLRIANVQSVLRIYLQLWLSKKSMMDLNRLECITNFLTLLSLGAILKTTPGFLKSFVLTCYGHQPGLITLKRERFMRVAKKHK